MSTSMHPIYRAKDCKDLNDVVIAISMTKDVITMCESLGKSTKAAYRRLISLQKKEKELKERRIKI